MPLIIITGIPSSGKTTTAHKLRDFFEGEKGKKVMIVSELNEQTPQRNDIYKDSAVEKTVRSAFKSEILRILNKEDIIIADGSNYIKGFRYELYCATKSYKTPQIAVHCDVSPSDTKEFNASKESEDSKYSEEIIDALVMRYEAPIYYNRWENPLFLSIKGRDLPLEDMYSALYERKPPPPNQSTQCQPLSDTNFVYELDRVTREINNSIMQFLRNSGTGEFKITSSSEVKIKITRNVNLPELNRTKRQFVSYSKSRAIDDVNKLTNMYIQYVNNTLFLVEDTS
uniref:Protein KTI12 homolog n=1 Tax=Lepeophtheirus salmonis TaxID=72036 RepID=D3PIY1_LEPSM|nr:Protein KTI12 homolog [Lepeophtheirus salmonis]